MSRSGPAAESRRHATARRRRAARSGISRRTSAIAGCHGWRLAPAPSPACQLSRRMVANNRAQDTRPRHVRGEVGSAGRKPHRLDTALDNISKTEVAPYQQSADQHLVTSIRSGIRRRVATVLTATEAGERGDPAPLPEPSARQEERGEVRPRELRRYGTGAVRGNIILRSKPRRRRQRPSDGIPSTGARWADVFRPGSGPLLRSGHGGARRMACAVTSSASCRSRGLAAAEFVTPWRFAHRRKGQCPSDTALGCRRCRRGR